MRALRPHRRVIRCLLGGNLLIVGRKLGLFFRPLRRQHRKYIIQQIANACAMFSRNRKYIAEAKPAEILCRGVHRLRIHLVHCKEGRLASA